MSSNFETQMKSGLPWGLIAGAVIAGVAAGLLLLRIQKAAPPAVPPATKAVVPPAVAPKPEPVKSVNPAKPEAAKPAAPQPTGKDELLDELQKKLSDSPDKALTALVEIGKTQPAQAIDLAQSLGRTDEEKQAWVKNLVQQWADDDPQAAWQWLGAQPAERMDQLAGNSLVGVVLDAMAAHDPKTMFKTVDALLRGDSPPGAILPQVAVQLGLQALVNGDNVDLARKAVESWAQDPLKPDIGTTAYETVAVAMGKTAPEAAGNWLKSMPASDERNTAIAAFTDSWADRDPNAALQWAETLTPTEGREAAINRTVSDWVDVNAGAATEWLGGYLSRAPADGEADRLIETVINVSTTVRNDPQLALKWADLISDPGKRATYEESEVLQWGRQDPAAATAYVRQSDAIPEAQKQPLIEKMQSRPASQNQAEPSDALQGTQR